MNSFIFWCYAISLMETIWQLNILWLIVACKNHSDWCIMLWQLSSLPSWTLHWKVFTCISMYVNVYICIHKHVLVCFVDVGVCRTVSTCYCEPWHGGKKLKETQDLLGCGYGSWQHILWLGSLVSAIIFGGLVCVQEKMLSNIWGESIFSR